MMTRAKFDAINQSVEEFVKRYANTPLRQKRKRGRPRTGIAKALVLAIQVDEFVQSGMSRDEAVDEVARLTRKNRQHVSWCEKIVSENDLDQIEARRAQMVERAKRPKPARRQRYAGQSR